MKKAFFAALLVGSSQLFAQDCEVTLENLKGKYQGDCAKGKAEGNGTANGVDTYTGDFKKGEPSGTGKYIWKHGDWYSGGWKNGMMDGQGEMHLVREDRTDSAVSKGFWKKGKYIGEYEKPYITHNMSSGINAVRLSQIKKAANDEINITVENTSSAGSALRKYNISDIQVLKGNYLTKYDNENSGNKNYYTLRMVTYPFRAVIRMGDESLEIEIFEKSAWTIEISILK